MLLYRFPAEQASSQNRLYKQMTIDWLAIVEVDIGFVLYLIYVLFVCYKIKE